MWLSTIPERHLGLLDIWSESRAGNSIPEWSAIDVASLEDWLGELHLVDWFDDDFTFVVYGTKIAAWTGRNWTGRRFSETDYTSKDNVRNYYRHVIEQAKPVAQRVEIPGWPAGHCWERLYLPFRKEKAKGTRILVHSVRTHQDTVCEPEWRDHLFLPTI